MSTYLKNIRLLNIVDTETIIYLIKSSTRKCCLPRKRGYDRPAAHHSHPMRWTMDRRLVVRHRPLQVKNGTALQDKPLYAASEVLKAHRNLPVGKALGTFRAYSYYK